MADTKTEKLSASLEDYLEAILKLTAESGVARSRDIAEELNVSRASVTGALRLLREKQLANHKPYGYVTLTDTGQAAAVEVTRKHEVLKSFLSDVLGVDAQRAQKAACRAEHTLGLDVIKRFRGFIEFINAESDRGYDLKAKFQRFYRKKASK